MIVLLSYVLLYKALKSVNSTTKLEMCMANQDYVTVTVITQWPWATLH